MPPPPLLSSLAAFTASKKPGPEQLSSNGKTTPSSVSLSATLKPIPARFNNPLPTPSPSHSFPKPRPYKPDLTPTPSPLRPHCLARQHLLLWTPTQTSPRSTRTDPIGSFPLSDDALDCILHVIGASWADSTKELYGTGLLTFHVYCDIHNIPDHYQVPMSSNLLSAFLSSCTGAHLGSTIANYAAALRAWHILHGLEWNIKELEYKAILEGANKLAPSSSKRAKCAPFTVDILEKFRHAMDLDNPRDATIFACIAISFYCVARLGEFTVPAIAKFDRTKHISRADVKFTFNHENLPVITFSLPCTKTSPEGENTHCAPHDPVSLSDPKTALDNHFRVNPAQPTDHLFATLGSRFSRHSLPLRPPS
jgi:hypothetical protein